MEKLRIEVARRPWHLAQMWALDEKGQSNKWGLEYTMLEEKLNAGNPIS